MNNIGAKKRPIVHPDLLVAYTCYFGHLNRTVAYYAGIDNEITMQQMHWHLCTASRNAFKERVKRQQEVLNLGSFNGSTPATY